MLMWMCLQGAAEAGGPWISTWVPSTVGRLSWSEMAHRSTWQLFVPWFFTRVLNPDDPYCDIHGLRHHPDGARQRDVRGRRGSGWLLAVVSGPAGTAMMAV